MTDQHGYRAEAVQKSLVLPLLHRPAAPVELISYSKRGFVSESVLAICVKIVGRLEALFALTGATQVLFVE